MGCTSSSTLSRVMTGWLLKSITFSRSWGGAEPGDAHAPCAWGTAGCATHVDAGDAGLVHADRLVAVTVDVRLRRRGTGRA